MRAQNKEFTLEHENKEFTLEHENTTLFSKYLIVESYRKTDWSCLFTARAL